MRAGIKLALTKGIGAIEEEFIIEYPHGIGEEHRLSLPDPNSVLHKGISLALWAAQAWAFGKHTPKEIAAYIVNRYKEHIKQSSQK